MATTRSQPPERSHYSRNWLSLAGLVIVLGSVFSFFFLVTLDLFAPGQNPYIGILTYLVAPLFFLLGGILWLWGWFIQRRRAARAVAGAPPTRFTIDISRPRDRRILLAVVIGAAMFLLLTAV